MSIGRHRDRQRLGRHPDHRHTSVRAGRGRSRFTDASYLLYATPREIQGGGFAGSAVHSGLAAPSPEPKTGSGIDIRGQSELADGNHG